VWGDHWCGEIIGGEEMIGVGDHCWWWGIIGGEEIIGVGRSLVVKS